MTATWSMHAHERNGVLQHLGERWWVELHGLRDPIVEVEVREVPGDDPAATHWAWTREGRDKPEFGLAWPNWGAFSMQFPYGPDAEMEAGKGRVVRLAVRKADEAGQKTGVS